jgi:hypothetical protein
LTLEIAIMPLHFAKSLSRSISAISAAALVHIGSASAAGSAADIQQQVRDLLTGNHAAHSLEQSGWTPDKTTRSNVDSQEFVRELLQGQTIGAQSTKPSESSGGLSTRKGQDSSSVRQDIQAGVRRMLLGEREVARHAS